MSYNLNDLPSPPHCPRCGATAHVHWAEVTAFGDPAPRVIAGYTHCVTQFCVDATGSNAVSWAPAPRDLHPSSWMADDLVDS